MRPVRIWLLWIALALPACSGKTDSPAIPPAVLTDLRLDAHVLRWETEDETRVYVRYGAQTGDYDHVAYPPAAGREDRAFRRSHQVPLLDLTANETVFVRVFTERTDGVTLASEEQEFLPTVGKVDNIVTSTMIHIGWGDSHLVTMPNGKRMLIDAGDDDAARSVREYFEYVGVTEIETALATHIHFDHIGGMIGNGVEPGILEQYPPRWFLDSPSKLYSRQAYDQTLDLLASEDIERVVVTRGQTSAEVPALALDPNVTIRVLNSGHPPERTPDGYDGTAINNESIVLRFSYGDVDWIIGGDAEFDAEGSMRQVFGSALESEYYKAHHHGRNDGSSLTFLQSVAPRVSLVPVSAQEYTDLPDYLGSTNPALGRLETVQSHWYVIDDLPRVGLDRSARISFNYNITFATDGVSYEVRAEIATQTTKSNGVHACEDHPQLESVAGGTP